jgi:hypothetical protein
VLVATVFYLNDETTPTPSPSPASSRRRLPAPLPPATCAQPHADVSGYVDGAVERRVSFPGVYCDALLTSFPCSAVSGK